MTVADRVQAAREALTERAAPEPTRRRFEWIGAAAVAVVGVFMLPALHAGFRGDDTWTSESHGATALRGESHLSQLWNSIVNFIESGRPNPLATIQGQTTSWVLGNSPFLTHAALVLLTMAAAWFFYAFVREVGMPRSAAVLMVVLVAGAVQFRSYHDASLGYWGTTQWVMVFLFASLQMFVRGLRSGSRRTLALSALLWLVCPLLYEASYPLAALFPVVALYERRGWAAWRAAAPHIAIGIAFVGLSLLLRMQSSNVVPGYEVGGSLWGAVRTYLIQHFAPIPGSNLFMRADYGSFLPMGSDPTAAELLAGFWRGAVVFAVVLVVMLLAGRERALAVPARTLGLLAALGAVIWTASITVISAAPKYQYELVPGKGHLPAFVQVFGWALLIAAAALALARVARRRSEWALRFTALGAAALLGAGAAADGYNNMRVVALEQPIIETRQLLERSVDDGVLEAMPESSTLLFSMRDLGWHTGHWNQVPEAFESMLIDRTGRRYDGRILPPDRSCDAPTGPVPDCETPPAPSAAWVRVRAYPGGGSVIVGRIERATVATTYSATTDDLRVLVRGSEAPPRVIGVTRWKRPWSSDGVSWRRADEGDGWTIYEARLPAGPLPVAATLDDAVGKIDFTGLGTADQIVRIYGTKSLLP